MKTKLILLAASIVVLVASCGGQDGAGPAAGSGGTDGGSGGAAPTGGKPGSGGATGSGGTTASGGGTGSGGHTATGGTTGSGGVTGSGGTGSGGVTASGGSPASATGGRGAAGGASAGSGGVKGSGGAGGAASGGTGPGGSGGTVGPGGASGTGGGASGGSAGGSSGSGGYQPCQSNPCKVLPLGDSITFGVNDEGNGGYRGPLFADIVAAGQKVTFTGSLMNGPTTVSGQTFPKRNEGHSGWGISEVTPYSNNNAGIATLIPSPAFSSGNGGTPEIILLHIGTNDATSFSAAQMQTDLKGLLDKLFTNAPSALVVLAQIIPLGYDANNAVIKAYNQALPGLVQTLAASGKHIVLVDMNTGYALSNFGSDNIHPSTAGYKFMADKWFAAIGPLLPR